MTNMIDHYILSDRSDAEPTVGMLEKTFLAKKIPPSPFLQGLFWMPRGGLICNFSPRNPGEQVGDTANVIYRVLPI